ncbi:MAG: hypothetical protein J6P16_07360 [Eubacterium sp.]|nr:hypothetical protein [Eubacterium sp.]
MAVVKKALRAVCICLIAVIMISCGSGDTTEELREEPTESAVQTPLPTPRIETITVFTIDPATMSILPSRVRKNEDDDSLSYITELVLNNLEDDQIKVSGVSQEKDSAIIVFDSTAKPVTGCDAEMETLILDCFANSILDNVEGCHSVIFRTDKGAYSSENLEMGEDEIYASR